MNPQVNPETLKLARDWIEVAGSFFGPLLLKAALWALVFGFAGLVVALILMTLIRRHRLLRREHRVWNLAAKLSYLIVLGVCLLVGVVGGALYGIQRDLDRAVSENLEPALAAQMPALRVQLARRLGQMAAAGVVTARDLVQPLVQEFLYQPESDGRIEQFKAAIINRLVLEVGAVAMNQAIQQALKQLPAVMASAGNGPQDDLSGFAVGVVAQALAGTGDKLNFSPLDRSVPEIFAETVRKQIDSQFKALYIGLAIKLLLVTLLIALEMLIYFKYYLPRRRLSSATKNPFAV
jgi:hypothetical protein